MHGLSGINCRVQSCFSKYLLYRMALQRICKDDTADSRKNIKRTGRRIKTAFFKMVYLVKRINHFLYVAFIQLKISLLSCIFAWN